MHVRNLSNLKKISNESHFALFGSSSVGWRDVIANKRVRTMYSAVSKADPLQTRSIYRVVEIGAAHVRANVKQVSHVNSQSRCYSPDSFATSVRNGGV